MLLQLSGYLCNPIDHAWLESTSPKLCFHVSANPSPDRFADPGMYTAIGDDLYNTISQQQINQNAGVMLRIPNSALRKHFERALSRRNTLQQLAYLQRTLHDKTYLP